jgi:hypothetical protein
MDYNDQYGNTIKGLFSDIENLSSTMNKHLVNVDSLLNNISSQIPKEKRKEFEDELKKQSEIMNNAVNDAQTETQKAREKHSK